MMVKLYWFFRIVAYVTTLGGAIWLFVCRTSANGGQEGLYAMGIGFLSFVISYAIYFCLRFCRDRRGP